MHSIVKTVTLVTNKRSELNLKAEQAEISVYASSIYLGSYLVVVEWFKWMIIIDVMLNMLRWCIDVMDFTGIIVICYH